MKEITQTQGQFELIYGNEKRWANTTRAGYDVIFNYLKKKEASEKHGVSVQAIDRFIRLNRSRHYDTLELAQAYSAEQK